jgi:hypothetical protein
MHVVVLLQSGVVVAVAVQAPLDKTQTPVTTTKLATVELD